MNKRGTFKSQRGGSDTVWVKHQTPWPQNFILGGPSKIRVLYDSISVFQWISGFCAIVKEESDLKTKYSMLEYISDLMDDAQDFGFCATWRNAKWLGRKPQKLTALGVLMPKGQPPITQMVQIPSKIRSYHRGPKLQTCLCYL